MEAALTKVENIEKALIGGDLSGLKPEERVQHYMNVCTSLGLNPHTKPFGYLQLNGKTVLYALKDATEQLRKIQGVSVTSLEGRLVDDLYIVTATARDREGRVDSATGAVNMKGLAGENKANAIMKAETKAKRRVTLSICGLGMLDDHEAQDIPQAKVIDADIAHVSLNLETPKVQEPAPNSTIDAATDELAKHVANINAATTLDKLKETWGLIPAAYHKALVDTLNIRKAALKENSNA